jgi:Cu+-exporting ATPase
MTVEPVLEFVAVPGKGVAGRLASRVGTMRLGSPAFLLEHGVAAELDRIAPMLAQGHTVVGVARDQQLIGWIALADAVRPTSARAVARLREAGIDVVMLTGDNRGTARTVAEAVGITAYEAGVSPEGKAALVRAMHARGIVTGMVGDGVNDAPALAAADVSFAMSAGTDIAVEASDVTLMRDDLNAVVDAIMLSRATLSKIRQNLFFAFAYNVLGIPLAAFGMLNPVIAGAAMAASSVSVVGNALLLKRWRPHD